MLSGCSCSSGERQAAAWPSGGHRERDAESTGIKGSKETAMRRLNGAKGLGMAELASWMHRCRSRLGAEECLYDPAGYVQLSWRIRTKKSEHFYTCKSEA